MKDIIEAAIMNVTNNSNFYVIDMDSKTIVVSSLTLEGALSAWRNFTTAYHKKYSIMYDIWLDTKVEVEVHKNVKDFLEGK